MIDSHPTLLTGDSLRRLSVVGAALAVAAVACSNDDNGNAATPVRTEGGATDAPVATAATTEAPAAAASGATAAGPDFGSGTASITLGDETFELAVGPGTGVCRDVFDIIQASGRVEGDRDIEGDFEIPPLDWESYEDGRYGPPSVQLQITSTGDDNASWIADAGWAAENDKVGQSQIDSYEKDGLTASGTVTFANSWDPSDEPVRGSFEVSCAEA